MSAQRVKLASTYKLMRLVRSADSWQMGKQHPPLPLVSPRRRGGDCRAEHLSTSIKRCNTKPSGGCPPHITCKCNAADQCLKYGLTAIRSQSKQLLWQPSRKDHPDRTGSPTFRWCKFLA